MGTTAVPDFRGKAQAIAPQLVELRRRIHQYPETGFAEVETARAIQEALGLAGIEVRAGVAGTGVMVDIAGNLPGGTVALRADMDALPVEERTGLPFASRRPGLMHACGHDTHVAVVVGAGLLLAAERHQLPGTVRLIFQPSEETPPGGALAMLSEGALAGVEAILGLHVNPYLPVGSIGIRDGTVMAAADMFTLQVLGHGGHGAAPHQAADAIVAAGAVIQALQTVASRLVDPLQPVVVTVGTIKGGYKGNVIADRVEMEGTVRTLCPHLRTRMPELLRGLVTGVTTGYNCTAELDYQLGYPPVQNNAQLVQTVREAGRRVLGRGRVFPIANPSMGGEDFAYYAEQIPGAFFFLGSHTGQKDVFPWHHPQFDVDERCIPAGAAVLARAAWDFLAGKGERGV